MVMVELTAASQRVLPRMPPAPARFAELLDSESGCATSIVWDRFNTIIELSDPESSDVDVSTVAISKQVSKNTPMICT